MRKARIPSLGIEALNLYSLLQPSDSSDAVLGDDRDRSAFAELLERGISESLNNQRRLHGRWAQDLFEAVAVSLDSIRLIKEEDSGRLYYDQEQPDLRLPDFRLILNDGRQLLVEVKNVAPSGIRRNQKLRSRDVGAAREYSRLTRADLYYAHFWAFSARWTLVNSDWLEDAGEFKILKNSTAHTQNEMGLLGDFYIGTRSLEFVWSLVADPGRAKSRV